MRLKRWFYEVVRVINTVSGLRWRGLEVGEGLEDMRNLLARGERWKSSITSTRLSNNAIIIRIFKHCSQLTDVGQRIHFL